MRFVIFITLPNRYILGPAKVAAETMKGGALLCKAVFRDQSSIIPTSLVTHGSVAALEERNANIKGHRAALA